jgi:hypothetical protein
MKTAVNRILPSNVVKKIKLKSYVKAYHEIKRNPMSKYIDNYDDYDTINKRYDYLRFRGHIDDKKEYSKEDIDYIFSIVREKNLSRMQRDLGSLS